MTRPFGQGFEWCGNGYVPCAGRYHGDTRYLREIDRRWMNELFYGRQPRQWWLR